MTNSGSVVEACELRRRYEGYEAVRGVSFRGERGELFALLGTNGAGKTSTLELVEGLGRPSGGTVRVLGHDPYTQRARLRPRVGVMLQEGGFPPDLTVAETAAMWGGTLTKPRPVAEALALFSALLAAVYYNLVTAYVARREELVLKRLRAGELTDAEILAGVASPAVAVALTQSVLSVVAGAVFLGLPVPVNAPLLLFGVAGGVIVFVLLAAASSVFTRTAELAQITTLPILLGCLFGSGLMVPLEELPDPVGAALRGLPLSPVVELMRLGWVGTAGERAPEDFAGAFGPAAVPALVLVAWMALGTVAIRYWFRWEPRR